MTTIEQYDGGKSTYTFMFDYLRKRFVKVALVHTDGSSTDLTYNSDYTIDNKTVTLVSPASADNKVRIYRETSTDRITTFVDASILYADNLNTMDVQSLHLTEESKDSITFFGMRKDATDNKFDAQNSLIKNVADGIDDNDAINASQLNALKGKITAAEDYAESVANSATKAANSAIEVAEGYAKGAANSATEAANSATEAANSVTEAANSAIEVAEGYAKGAANSATEAANSVTEAANSATEAANSATEAATSATEAANSATEAANSATKAANIGVVVPTGVIQAYAGTTAPSGYLFCQGQTVNRTTYAGLFNIIGTTYGAGNGSTTFNVPDLTGRFPGGFGAGVTVPLGSKGGEASHTLTVDEMPSHTHSAWTDSQGNHAHTTPVFKTTGRGFGVHYTGRIDARLATDGAGAHEHNIGIGANGGNAAHNNMPPYLVINYIIKY